MLTFQSDLQIINGAKQAALYDLATGNVYAINKSGAMIVEMLLQGMTIENIARKIAAEQDAEFETVHSSIQEFIDELNKLKIIGEKENFSCVNVNSQPVNSHHTFRQVWCELTSRCNLRCLHCYASAGENPATDMPTDIWLNIIQQICELGCDNLQLTGGEPFLRRDLWKFVDAALSSDTNVEIYSNLTLCNVDDVAKYKGRIRIATTILGPNAEVHDGITQVKGSFLKTTAAISQLIKADIPVRAGMIVMAQNSQYVDETLAFIESLGVKQYGTDYMRLVGRGETNQEHSIKTSSNPDVVKYPFSITTSRSSFEHNHQYNPCWGQTLAIKPDGAIIPCVFGRSIPLGNVLEKSLAALIKQENIQKLWEITLDSIETCRDCEFRYACHDCRPLAIYEGNGLSSRTPRCSYNPYSGLW